MAREESELRRRKFSPNTGRRPLRLAPRLVDARAPQWASGAARTATPLQWLCGLAACVLLAVGLVTAPAVVHHLLFGLFALAALTRLAAALTPRLASPAPPIPEQDLPRYTVIAPLYREAAIAPDLVAALQALDYPRDRLQALIVLESDDSETWDALTALPLPAFIQVLAAPPGYPRTTPRASRAMIWLCTSATFFWKLRNICDVSAGCTVMEISKTLSRLMTGESQLSLSVDGYEMTKYVRAVLSPRLMDLGSIFSALGAMMSLSSSAAASYISSGRTGMAFAWIFVIPPRASVFVFPKSPKSAI